MRAVINERYGSEDVLEVRDLPVPELESDRVLVRVRAAAINPLDWHFMTGTPYFLRLIAGLRGPKQQVRGADVAGVVEAVGSDVTAYRTGDEVFGGGPGTFAEFVACRERNLARKPGDLGFDEAAALPVAAVTALQGLRDHAGVRPGTSVLINGASGGVGPYAVQIAKHLGAEVTAVCSTRNVNLIRSLGADHVIDYTTDDFAAMPGRYDAILDNVGNRSLNDCRQALTDTGVLVIVSGPKHNRLLGPVTRFMLAKLRFMVGKQRAVTFTADETHDELATLADLVESGVLRSVIDRTYPLDETADAMRYLAEGHAQGKIIIDVEMEAAVRGEAD
jgi:NADPH:quinone reductase-like Zn-dependent oxidoreductase